MGGLKGFSLRFSRTAPAISPEPGVAVVPPIELVALVTRMGRELPQWKKETLVDFARVSLSTVERVESADRVDADSRDRIARALGYEPGAFTEPRVPIPRQRAAEEFVEETGDLEPVAVREWQPGTGQDTSRPSPSASVRPWADGRTTPCRHG